MSYTKQNFWCSAPSTMTSAAQFGRYFNFSASAIYRSRFIQLQKLPQKTSYSFNFDVIVSSISTQQNQVLMMDPETGTQIVNITGGKFGAYSTSAGDLTGSSSEALTDSRYNVAVSISSDPLLLITITTTGDTTHSFEAVRSTNATVINEFLEAMQHCPMLGVPYDLTNYSYFWRGTVILTDMVITSGAETVFSAYETFTGDMKVADYSVTSGTPQISGATLNMLSSGIPQFKNIFVSDMDSFEIITKMTFFKSVSYPTQAYRGGLFFLWQTPIVSNYARINSRFCYYQTGSADTDSLEMDYIVHSDDGGYYSGSKAMDPVADIAFGVPTWYKAVVLNNVGGSSVTMQIYKSTDKITWTKIADEAVTNSGTTQYRFNFTPSWLLSFGGYGPSSQGSCGLMDLSETYVTSKGRVIWQAFEPSTGSVEIDKGYYNTGSGEIWMPKSKYFLDTLADGQTLGWSNKLYAVTKNGQASARICEDTLTGDFQASHLLDTTVYLNYNKDLIIPSPIDETITLSYQNQAFNYNNVGSVAIDSSYVASGFNTTKYLVIANGDTGEVMPFPASSANTWEMVYKIKYSNASTTQRICGALNNTSLAQCVIGIDNHKLITWISSNGSSWNISNGVKGSTSLVNTVDYWVKAVYDGSKYVISLSTNGTTYTPEITINNSTKVFTNNSSFLIGNAEQSGYLKGSIYLQDCYIDINGERWWTPVITPTAVKYSKGSLLDADTGVTYYLPSETIIPLSSISLIKDRDYCYLINRSGHDTSEGVVWSSSYYSALSKKLMSYVYLNPSHTKVLGFENNSIELEASSSSTITVVPGKDWMYTGADFESGPSEGSLAVFTGATSYAGSYTVNVSDLFSAGDTSLSGYLMWDQYQNKLVAYTKKDAQSSNNGGSSFRFTGYVVTCTDATHTVIASLEKKGQLCRVYATNHRFFGQHDGPLPVQASVTLYITYDEYNAWQQTETHASNSIPIRGYTNYGQIFNNGAFIATDVSSTSSMSLQASYIVYRSRFDRFEATAYPHDWFDPISAGGEYWFSYVGDYYVIFPDPQNGEIHPDSTDV